MTTLIFFVTFGLVFVKAFQQRNVAYGNFMLLLPTSYLFSAFDYFLTGMIADLYLNGGNAYAVIFWMGTASWAACMSAIHLHRKVTTSQPR